MTETRASTAHRRSERFPLAWPARWHLAGLPQHDTEVLDLTEFGAFVACADPESEHVHAGDGVVLVLLVGGERFTVDGHVRWIGESPAHHKMGFGVAFDAHSVYLCEAMTFALMQAHPSGQRVATA